jgi:hypothetical protein
VKLYPKRIGEDDLEGELLFRDRWVSSPSGVW